jgi:hypothetical protein
LVKVGVTALRSGFEWSVAALPAQVISNAVSHEPLGEGMLSAFGTSFGEGFALGALDGLLFSGREASNAAPAHNEAEEAAVPAPQPPPDAPGGGDNAPAPGPPAGQNVQAVAPAAQNLALVVWRPPLTFRSLVLGRQLIELESAIPRFIRPSLLPPPPPMVLDLPNGRITFLDQSQFDLPPKVTIEFDTYLALPWYENGTAAGEMIK